jgi:RNA polymerase sigma-70 factor (ECF subfamily)
MVEGFIARRVPDAHSVADLTADVFLAAINAATRFDHAKGSASAWLVGIAYRVVAQEQRRLARRWRAHSRAAGRRVLEPDAIGDLEALIDRQRAARQMRAGLDGLSSRDRALLELTAVDGLTTADAAQALGLHPTTARVRLHRVKQRLRAEFAEAALTARSAAP